MKENKKFETMNRVMIAIATITVMIIAINLYAAMAGYGNIFIMTKKMFTNQDVSEQENLLKDRDNTISNNSNELKKYLSVFAVLCERL